MHWDAVTIQHLTFERRWQVAAVREGGLRQKSKKSNDSGIVSI